MIYLKTSKANETIEEVIGPELHEPDEDVNIYETASRHDDAVSEEENEIEFDAFDVFAETTPTYYINEKMLHLLRIDRKDDTKMFLRSYKDSSNEPLSFEPKTILLSDGSVLLPCQKFSGKKALSNFNKQRLLSLKRLF